MDIEKLLERAEELGHTVAPFSVGERESAVELIFTTYQKPLEVGFVKSILSQAGIDAPNLNNTLHMMKRAGKIKNVSRGVYKATATEPNIVNARVHKKFLDSMGQMFALKKEISQREDDIEKLQGKVDDMRREKRAFKQTSDEV
ncbi:hypothetical protein [Nitrosopumilus sp.]|uniref:hypothetical protein n=1 Tax=Nitrosopumilus sp. TaxID=2024843 RepID=UPI0034A013EC